MDQRKHNLFMMPLVGFALIASATTASGQMRAGSDGRALDASPQVGVTSNRLENQVDYQARNNLITGNVADGFNFRDEVGYTAPGQFQGVLGSDDLFRFRADSLGSAPQVLNLPGRRNATGGDVSVYNNFTAPGTGTLETTSGRILATDGASFKPYRDVYNATRDNQINLSQRPETLRGQAGETTLGIIAQPDGTALSVSADPLTGVRQTTLRTGDSLDARMQRDANLRPNINDTLDNPAGLRDTDSQPEDPNRVSSYVAPRTTTSGINQALGNPDVVNRENLDSLANRTGQVSPTLMIGQMSATRLDGDNQTLEQRVAQLEKSIFSRGMQPSSTREGMAAAEAPEDAYTKLLREIQAQARMTDEQQADEAGDKPDNRPEWMKMFDEPTEQQLTAAEQRRADMLDRIRAGRTDDEQATADADNGSEGSATGSAATADGSNAPPSPALERLMENLDYDVRLESMVADREGRVNELFEQAETQMAGGKFLEAERTYRLLRVTDPDNPLARSGLIHAQLGAGMIRSAAFNLRDLFEQHPELIATRYGEKILPPRDRMEWLRGELQRMVDSNSSSFDPGMMLAYLGHQVESRQLVRYGLAIAEEAAPRDPLLPVLRRIWLDEKEQADSEPADQK
jgi:hypothetical protein